MLYKYWIWVGLIIFDVVIKIFYLFRFEFSFIFCMLMIIFEFLNIENIFVFVVKNSVECIIDISNWLCMFRWSNRNGMYR